MIPIPTHGAPPWRRGGQPQSNEFRPSPTQDRKNLNAGERSYQTNMIGSEDSPAGEDHQEHAVTYIAEAEGQTTGKHSDTRGRPPENEQFDETHLVGSDTNEEKDDRKKEEVGNRRQDAWILLFTCLGSRYVATELVTNMKTTTVLNALRRLTATFGTPSTIICDNAKQFVMLKEASNTSIYTGSGTRP
ncbi:unnamed protein product [Caenorhabditis bovis]|uniref:Integrase catalytic domain-containing protein n=1 Tax=Caenorhabditis bovis TaxID=2654633 RepID=A0A8S1ER58_9PELO|nr:unnamed protein product [Caenorhabditis bovis]